MADPIKFNGSNQVFTPAPGTEHAVRDLPCHYDQRTGEMIVCVRLSDVELARVRETGEVWFAQKGGKPPMVFPMAISGLPLMKAVDPEGDPDVEIDRYASSGDSSIARLTPDEVFAATAAPYEAFGYAGLTHLTLADIWERLLSPTRFSKPDLISAKVLAVVKHGTQLYAQRAYPFHLNEVDRILLAAGFDAAAYRCGGWLHDIVEDTEVNISEVRERFGNMTADLVWSCSGFGKNRRERNADYYRKLADYKPGWPVKAADRICHCETSLADHDTHYAGLYAKESEEFEANALPFLTPYLADRLMAAHAAARMLVEKVP